MFGQSLEHLKQQFLQIKQEIEVLTFKYQSPTIIVEVSLGRVESLQFEPHVTNTELINAINQAFESLSSQIDLIKQQKTELILEGVPAIFRQQVKQALLEN